MKIPIFMSCPSTLNEEQRVKRNLITCQLEKLHLEPRTLGQTDYPVKNPLYEVFVIARHCAGGIIMGFSQTKIKEAIEKEGTVKENEIQDRHIPTPWNNLEAGILYASGLPLIVFKEEGVSGGVFDLGASDVYINSMPCSKNEEDTNALCEALLSWQTMVRAKYYGFYRQPNGIN